MPASFNFIVFALSVIPLQSIVQICKKIHSSLHFYKIFILLNRFSVFLLYLKVKKELSVLTRTKIKREQLKRERYSHPIYCSKNHPFSVNSSRFPRISHLCLPESGFPLFPDHNRSFPLSIFRINPGGSVSGFE